MLGLIHGENVDEKDGVVVFVLEGFRFKREWNMSSGCCPSGASLLRKGIGGVYREAQDPQRNS